MATEIRVPTLGESVTEATIGKWFKKVGDAIAADEPLVELETDKVTVEVPAPAAGTLSEIAAKEGETVGLGALLGHDPAGGAAAKPAAKAEAKTEAKPEAVAQAAGASGADHRQGSQQEDRRDRRRAARSRSARCRRRRPPPSCWPKTTCRVDQVAGSGKRGQVLKGDVLDAIAKGAASQPAETPRVAEAPVAARAPSSGDDASREERVRMTQLRQTIARRLKEAQTTAAMLTTFNEVDMKAVMDAAHQVQGPVREEARREARLHGLLHQGGDACAEGDPGGQRRDRRHRHHLQELRPYRRRRRHREGPRRAGGARCRPDVDRRDREGDRPARPRRARRQARPSPTCRAAPSPSPMAASTAR